MAEPVDWFRLLWDLRVRHGLSIKAVARKLGVSPWRVRAVWNGHEPKHSLGEKLLSMKTEQKPHS